MLRLENTLLVVCAIFIALTISTYGRAFTAEELVQLKWLTHPEFSPDGKAVAFQVRIADMGKSKYQQDIYLHDLASGETRPLLFTDQNEENPRWSPDSKYLGFLSNRGDSSDSVPVKQVWLLPLDGGEARKITDSKTDIEQFRFSQDGRYIYYLAERERPASQQRLRNLDDEKKLDVVVVGRDRLPLEFWRYDLQAEKSKLIYRGDPGIDEFDLSGDGRYIVYRSNVTGDPDREIDYNLYLLTIADSTSTLLADLGNEEDLPRFAPNSKVVAFLAPQNPKYSYSQEEINVVELSSRKVTKLSGDIDLGVEEYAWSDDSRSLYVDVEAGTNSGLYQVSLADLSINPLLTGQQYISALSAHGDSLVMVFETATTAPEIGILPLTASKLSAATTLNKLPEDVELPHQEVITYRSSDDTEIEAVLWQPLDFTPMRKYPAVVSVHGGPSGRTTNTLFNRLEQYLAGHGYVVISPNYRGSTGYYADFNIADFNDLGGRDYQDVMAGVDYLEGLGYVDPEAIGITGGSYGGYMTNWAISQSNRFAAAVSEFGIFNFFTDYGGSEWSYWEREYLGNYWDDDSLWLARSPADYAAQINTPVLIMHGEEDPNTFITNSMEMYRALKDLGRTVEFVKLPREGHGFGEPQHRIIEMHRTANWFDQYMQVGEPFAVTGEQVSSDNATLTFLSAQKVTLKALPPPDGQYLLLRVELSSRDSEPPTIHFDDDFLLITSTYRRLLPSGLLVQNRLVTGSSIELRRQVFTAELVYDLPKDAKSGTLRVDGFAPLRIKF